MISPLVGIFRFFFEVVIPLQSLRRCRINLLTNIFDQAFGDINAIAFRMLQFVVKRYQDVANRPEAFPVGEIEIMQRIILDPFTRLP